MSMQDKEMDELFRAKLDNLEIQPSNKVWKGIVVELDGAKRKRSLVPVIRIAASITVFIAVGLFFMLRGNKVADQVATRIGIKHQRTELTARGEATEEGENISRVIQSQQIASGIAKLQQADENRSAGKIKLKKTKTIKDNSIAASTELRIANYSKHSTTKTVQPSVTEVSGVEQERGLPLAHQTLAALPEKEIKPTQGMVPDEPLNTDKPVISGGDDFKTGNKVASIQLPAVKPAKAKKHGIRTFGDLINVVVAKVDKRQDKVIHFSDSDDDEESNITSINLGFVKVKKDEK